MTLGIHKRKHRHELGFKRNLANIILVIVMIDKGIKVHINGVINYQNL